MNPTDYTIPSSSAYDGYFDGYSKEVVTGGSDGLPVYSGVSSSSDSMVTVLMDDRLVYQDTSENFASEVSSRLNRLVNVFVKTIKSLKLNREYNGTFIAYLSGQLSEEEFLEEAEKYAYEPTTEITEETLREIKILYENTKLEFSPSEIAEIFHLDFDACAEAISSMDLAVAKS